MKLKKQLLISSCLLPLLLTAQPFKKKKGYLEYCIRNCQKIEDTIVKLKFYIEDYGTTAYIDANFADKSHKRYLIKNSSVYEQLNDSFYYHSVYKNHINTFFSIINQDLNFNFTEDIKTYVKKKRRHKGKSITTYKGFVSPDSLVQGEYLRIYKNIIIYFQIRFYKPADVNSNAFNRFHNSFILQAWEIKERDLINSQLLSQYLTHICPSL